MKKMCMILSLSLILCFMGGCQNKEAMAELEEFRSQVEVEKQNKEIALLLYEEIDKQNFDAAIDMFAVDAKVYGAGSFEPIKPEVFRPIFPVWFTAFPDYVHDIKDVIANKDKVVIRTEYTGTHEGDFFGAPPTGNSFKYLGIHILTFKDNKIVEAWILEDMLYLWQQLGMELKPKEEK